MQQQQPETDDDSQALAMAEMGPKKIRACVVLPAAGCGERMNSSIPKQFLTILGRPLIVHTIECFQSVPWVESILVAVPPEFYDYTLDMTHKFQLNKARVVEGGATRHRSIQTCVERLNITGSGAKCLLPDVIIVHDAVRPFVEEETLNQLAKAAIKHGASGATLPLVSTVVRYREENGHEMMDYSLVRQYHRASHTPQVFCSDIITTAYEKASVHDLDYGTECLHLVRQYTDVKVALIQAPNDVWKVTHRRDFYAAEGIARERGTTVVVVAEKESTMTSFLRQKLLDKRMTVPGVCDQLSQVSPEANCIVLVLPFGDGKGVRALCQEALQIVTENFAACLLLLAPVQLSEEVVAKYRRMVMSLAAKCKAQSVCVYCLLIESEASPSEAVCKEASIMTSDLVFDRRMSLTGQVFVITSIQSTTS